MERKITWLHFSDLHYGQKTQNILLPKIKKELLKDIEYIKKELGKIDIVFFSGDLTQSGAKEEFDELTAFLKEIWAHFNRIGSNPYLVAIPGNHDLTRPEDSTKAVVKVLKNYQSDEELKESFWLGIRAQNENYDFICQCFKNFDEWYKHIDLPKPEFRFGLLPGDFSSQLTINDIQLNIVGLNTAFLELSNNDYMKKLIINPEQVIAVTSKDPFKWIENADIAILMTHHDPSWYDNTSADYYNNDINPANTYYSHLCGHLHEPNTSESRLLGSDLRRTQLAPSLFGLYKINDTIERIHGYYAGNYLIKDNSVHERFYPRIAIKRHDGTYAIAADNGFNLNNKSYLELTYAYKKAINTKAEEQDCVKIETPEENIVEENILDLNAGRRKGTELDNIPRINYTSLPQHANIRLVEQQNFVRLIESKKYAWLITDWGLNEGGFIGSVSEQLHLDKIKSGFILNCEDIINEKELISAFDTQFGMALQRFCNLAAGLTNTLLVLDHVNAHLYTGNSAYQRLLDIINSIIDFCPGIYIIIVARQAPVYVSVDNCIKLSPLDSSDVKSYLNNHPGDIHELESSENFLKLIEITSGLPKHIDRIIESLKVSSFQELFEAEKEASIDFVNIDQVPKSLKQAISSLADSTDRMKLRSFKLLKILTILSNGETIGNLRKFDGTEPIFIDNANELEQLSLLEVISTAKILSKVEGKPTQQVKILRVPRQIRDYVNTLITDNDRDSILKLGCDMYFGDKWRSGTIKNIFSSSSLFEESKFVNIDNCHLITNNLMANAIKDNNNFEIERAANIAIKFCDSILKHGDYTNVVNTSEEIYNWLKPTEFNRLKAANAKLYGKALRMTRNEEKSNQILNEALEIEGANFSNDEKNQIYSDLGFTYILQEKFDSAIKCAKEIEKTARPKGVYHIQAKFITAQATLSGEDLLKRLRTLEAEARKAKSSSLEDTISLTITELETNKEIVEKRLSKVIESKGSNYNKVRAIVKKSLDSLTDGKGIISLEDLNLLNFSYSYLYTQRLGSLFDDCHSALWIYCTRENRIQDLLNLFKHSSLIWRITDDTELEKEYFLKLDGFVSNQTKLIASDSLDLVNMDYFIRRKLELGSVVE